MENGAASPGRWQVWQCFWRTGASSLVNVGCAPAGSWERDCTARPNITAERMAIRAIERPTIAISVHPPQLWCSGRSEESLKRCVPCRGWGTSPPGYWPPLVRAKMVASKRPQPRIRGHSYIAERWLRQEKTLDYEDSLRFSYALLPCVCSRKEWLAPLILTFDDGDVAI